LPWSDSSPFSAVPRRSGRCRAGGLRESAERQLVCVDTQRRGLGKRQSIQRCPGRAPCMIITGINGFWLGVWLVKRDRKSVSVSLSECRCNSGRDKIKKMTGIDEASGGFARISCPGSNSKNSS
jgi:hypothetical protein